MTGFAISVTEKRCSKCGQIKICEEFHRHSSHKSGLASQCKLCREVKNKSLAYAAIDASCIKRCYKCGKKKAAGMFWKSKREKDGRSPDCMVCLRQRLNQWRKNSPLSPSAHADVTRAYAREYRKEHPHDWRKHRERNIAAAHTYRTRIAGNGGSFTAKDIANMQYIQQGHCCYCGRVGLPLTIDHIHPVKHGGPSDPWNLALCCRSCNSSKGDRTLEEWIKKGRWFDRN